jgi:DNA-binding CsgD family transcriptional regulator
MTLATLMRTFGTDALLNKIKKLWLEYHRNVQNLVSIEIDIDTTLLDTISENSPIVHVIFDSARFSIHYVGKNVYDKIGYTNEEFMKDQFKMIFKIMKLEHILFFTKVLNWDSIANKILTEDMRKEFYSFVICGLSFKHKDGRQVKTMMRSYGLKMNEKGYPIYGIIELTEVGHLFRSDEYWVHVTAGKTNQNSISFFSNQHEIKEHWLISPRELEVLKLIELGLSSKEIGIKMFLSIHTIEKHRKNMLRRTGATDSNALIELCKRCNIL